MDGISYFDIRHVTGESTHIDIDNGVTESAGTSFFDHAVIRALTGKGWGIFTVDNFGDRTEKEIRGLIRNAGRISKITAEEVTLADIRRGILTVPSMHEDPRDVSLEEKAELILSIEQAAKVSGVVNTRANYIERFENVTFRDT